MELYVTRHGQTDFNARGLVCGATTDIPLTDVGREQAHSLQGELEGIQIDQVLVSPMLRARQTADLALAGRSVAMEIEPRLIEFNFGTYEGVRVDDPDFVALRANFAFRYPEGESLLEAVARVYSVIEELPQRFPDKAVLLVCHGAISRIVRSYFVSQTDHEFHTWQMPNCALLHFTMD